MEIKCLLFDLGKVVLTNDWHLDDDHYEIELSNYLGISIEKLENALMSTWKEFEAGMISEKKFWMNLFEALNIEYNENERIEVRKIWEKYQHENEDMVALLKILKEKYRLFALTNISKEFLEYKLDKFALNNYFEKIIASSILNIAKPDIRFFEKASELLPYPSQECLFIDDHPKNLESAKKLGFNTFLFTDQKSLEEYLKEQGIM